MKEILLLVLSLLSLSITLNAQPTIIHKSFESMTTTQMSATEATFFLIPEQLVLDNGQYKIQYYTDSTYYYISKVAVPDSCDIKIVETDSLLINMEKLFSNFPIEYDHDIDDTAFFVFYSRLYHKIFNQPILYNTDLNYFSSIYTWLWMKDYMVTAIINDNGKISLKYANREDSVISEIMLNRIVSKSISHKIKKIAQLPIDTCKCENFMTPPIIIEYKYKGKYNALPFVSFESPKPYIKSYRLTKKLHRIAVRKLK